MRIINIVLLGLFVMPIAEAFQLLSIAVWDVDRDTPTLWIKFDEKLVTSEFEKTEFRDKSTPLDGIEPSEQMKTILKSVLDDYNVEEYANFSLYFGAGFSLQSN